MYYLTYVKLILFSQAVIIGYFFRSIYFVSFWLHPSSRFKILFNLVLIFDTSFIEAFTNITNPVTTETEEIITQNFVLLLPNGENIPITNYTFDAISDTNNITLILRLHSPLSSVAHGL